MTEKALTVRAHHLVCLLHYATFGGNHPTLPALLAALREDPDRMLRIVAGPDDICTPCPHWNGTECVREEGMEPKNRAKDLRFLAALGFAENVEMRASDLLRLITRRLDPATMRAVCPDCEPAKCSEAISRLAAASHAL